jgi:membrane complex biogenesis BtpA family protein
VIEGRAHETIRLRDRIGADVELLADVDVKHSAPLAERDLAAQVADVVERGHADGVVVSGAATGDAVSVERVREVAEAAADHGARTFVGSGVTAETVADLLGPADGVIVGTALKTDGETTAPVDEARVAALLDRARSR